MQTEHAHFTNKDKGATTVNISGKYFEKEKEKEGENQVRYTLIKGHVHIVSEYCVSQIRFSRFIAGFSCKRSCCGT